MGRDLACALIALVVAGAYIHETSKIQVSALADTVGSGGFPLILGWLLAASAVLLAAQAVLKARTAGQNDLVEPGEQPEYPFRQAAGLTLIAVAFIASLPFVGYIVCVALLLAAVMRYQGLPVSRHTLVVAAGGALFLHGLFGLLLGIPLPAGLWASLLR